jgi:hypothetical protein
MSLICIYKLTNHHSHPIQRQSIYKQEWMEQVYMEKREGLLPMLMIMIFFPLHFQRTTHSAFRNLDYHLKITVPPDKFLLPCIYTVHNGCTRGWLVMLPSVVFVCGEYGKFSHQTLTVAYNVYPISSP